jgi:hypothetical protein
MSETRELPGARTAGAAAPARERERAPEAIRIDDLAAPRLTRAQKALLESARGAPASTSVEQVLSAARDATGLSDFGADDFRERLALWLRCIEEDTPLTALGRANLFGDCVRLAANRLRVEDLLRRHPEILQIPLERPIIIAGLPRSGTTHLVNLISADSRLRSLPLWESMEPVPASSDVVPPGQEDPRRARTRQFWGAFEEALPYMRAMHEMAPDHTHEEIELQQIDFSSYNLEWLCRPPRWRDYYLSHDQTPHYLYGRKVLQVLTWLRGPRRWVLKSPQHMEQLIPLRRAFPDATLVITHRDPIAVIQSAVTMLAYGDRIRRDPVDPPATAAYWIDRIERLLRACVRDREHWGTERSLDVLFHQYMADEDGTLRAIYALAGLPLTDAARRELSAYLASNPRGKHGRVVYDLAGDFGVDVGELRRRFEFYYQRFPVIREE